MQHGESEKYLTPEYIESLDLNGEIISNLLPNLSEKQREVVSHFNGKKTLETIVACDEAKRGKIIEILDRLDNSNSSELRRIKEEIAIEILQLDEENYEKTFEEIEKIFLTSSIPTVGKRFLVFQKLHPNYLGEEIDGIRDDSTANIPSLNNLSNGNKKRRIFAQLLKCSLQSNDRNLQRYIETIENGDMLYKQAIEHNRSFASFSDDEKEILKEYRDILHTLYKQTSRGKKDEQSKLSKDVIEDLNKLNNLLGNKNISMPDRVVRLFCPLSGIRTMREVKENIAQARKKALDRSLKVASGEISIISEGDFIKGVYETMFFNSMLENGILAKDFLGGNATHDGTPFDADVEKVIEIGTTLSDTLSRLKHANDFTRSDVSGKKLGTILLVFDKEEYIETRSSNSRTNTDAIEQVKNDISRDEIVYNGGSAYGIIGGSPSTKIKAIIVERYIDKMALTVALSAPTYIPVVNMQMEVLLTKDMYDKYHSQMQGLSHYKQGKFTLDKTARNSQIEQIALLVDDIQENAKRKSMIILNRLEEAVNRAGYTLSDKRLTDLLPGIIEFIDTGSTGRGTNEPGDGDFDFMVRMDRILEKSPEELKKYLNEVLSRDGKIQKPEVTGRGDFRYKGINLKELNGITADLDLSFTIRTDEIEYSTDECIKDRLNTIRKQSKEDYRIVIANILVAKKMMKKAGAYKKKDAAAPENGEPDTRGGLGGVGIENWILQNGGSFERAARTFIEAADKSNNLGEFQQNYSIWDFGENHVSTYKNIFSHDNFVFNLNEQGYKRMTEALRQYLNMIDEQKREDKKKGIQDLVMEDTSIIKDTLYMQTIESIMAKKIELERQQGLLSM